MRMHAETSCLLVAVALAAQPCLAAPRPGSVAVYSDGSVLKLLAVTKDSLLWQDQRLRQIHASVNPVRPPLLRTGLDGSVQRSEHLQQGKPDRLLDAPPGTTVEFRTLRRDAKGHETVRNHACTYLGEEHRPVLGHERRLMRFRCERYKIHSKLWTRLVKERREFTYSPALGVVVAEQHERGGHERRRWLLGIMAPKEYGYSRLRALLAGVKKRGDK